MAANNVPSQLTPKINTPMAEFWCCTQGKVNKFRYVWTINNFSFYCDQQIQHLESPTFSAKDNSKWCIKIDFDIDIKYISMFLHLVSCNKSEITAAYKLSFVKDTGENIVFKEIAQNFQSDIEINESGIAVDLYFLLYEGKGLVTDDKLTILCECSTLTDITNISGRSHSVQFEVPEWRQSDILEMMFESEKFSDVTLTVCGRKFQAHKAILAAQSPVFSAMFEHDTEERKKDHVDITDMDYEVLTEMLRFIYTDKTENLEKIADVLLAAADKYALEKLKIMCEEALYPNLIIENAAEILMFADLNNADQLKSRAIDFIISNAPYVMDTEGFRSMVNSHPHLIGEVFRVATHPIQSIELCSGTPESSHRLIRAGRRLHHFWISLRSMCTVL